MSSRIEPGHTAAEGLDTELAAVEIVLIEVSDLELTPITEGDIVIIFGGYEPPRGDKWPTFAPLSRQASEGTNTGAGG